MPQLLSSKNLLLSTRPLTVGVISQPETLTEVLAQSPEQRAAACDLFELRLDLLKLDTADLRAAIPKLDLPVLLTARHPAEGGQGTEAAAGRIALLEPLLDLAALIDIELRSAGDMRALMQKARGQSVGVVGVTSDALAAGAIVEMRDKLPAGWGLLGLFISFVTRAALTLLGTNCAVPAGV
jgi:3-dehydroquinate dehydratase-1